MVRYADIDPLVDMATEKAIGLQVISLSGAFSFHPGDSVQVGNEWQRAPAPQHSSTLLCHSDTS